MVYQTQIIRGIIYKLDGRKNTGILEVTKGNKLVKNKKYPFNVLIDSGINIKKLKNVFMIEKQFVCLVRTVISPSEDLQEKVTKLKIIKIN